MQDKHRAHQQEEVKGQNEIDQIVLEPGKEHRQMHVKISLDIIRGRIYHDSVRKICGPICGDFFN